MDKYDSFPIFRFPFFLLNFGFPFFRFPSFRFPFFRFPFFPFPFYPDPKSITCEIRDSKMFEIIGMQYLDFHHFPRTNAVRGR